MFKIYKSKTSKGIEYWVGFENEEPFMVSEISEKDALEKAQKFLNEHKRKPEMGSEIAMLLIWNYERDRTDQMEIPKE